MDGNGKLDFDEFRALIFRSKMRKEGVGVGESASVTESLSESSAVSSAASSAVSRSVQLFLPSAISMFLLRLGQIPSESSERSSCTNNSQTTDRSAGDKRRTKRAVMQEVEDEQRNSRSSKRKGTR